jgi:hypothetical protein
MNAQKILAFLKAYPLAIGLFLAAILMGGWAYWRSGTLDDARANRDDLSAKNDLYFSNYNAGKNLDEHLAQLKDDLKALEAAEINPAQVIPNQQYFFDFEQSSGVQIINPGQGLTIRGKDATLPSVTTFTLSATGEWDNIISMLYGLQTGPHLLRFNTFRLERSTQTSGNQSDLLNLTLTLEFLGQ